MAEDKLLSVINHLFSWFAKGIHHKVHVPKRLRICGGVQVFIVQLLFEKEPERQTASDCEADADQDNDIRPFRYTSAQLVKQLSNPYASSSNSNLYPKSYSQCSHQEATKGSYELLPDPHTGVPPQKQAQETSSSVFPT